MSAPFGTAPLQIDNAMVKALARAFRWRRMLDTGVYTTIDDLAKAKGIGKTYVSQVVRLTLLAPEIVEAILDGRQPAEVQLDDLLAEFPLDWEGQKRLTSTWAGLHSCRALSRPREASVVAQPGRR